MANLITTNVDGALATIGLGASVAVKVHDSGQVEFPVGVIPTESKLVSGTAVTLTNQTFVDFDIPAWAKRVTVMFAGVSTNGSSEICAQLGTSAAVETTGYFSRIVLSPSASANVDKTLTTGIVVAATSPSAVNTSFLQIAIYANNSWSGSVSNAQETSGVSGVGTFRKTLSGPLTTVRITTVNGTDQFDAGTVNVLYE